MRRCVDYLHWNPVKHGLVKSVQEYERSTFRKFAARGEYDRRWGSTDPCPQLGGAGWE
jgi:putative transposase